jgi:putative DNA primase/helicase
MNDFADFLRSLGLRPRAIVADGRWRRCATENHPHRKNGAYKLSMDGRIGWGQDWAVHSEPATWRPEATEDAPVLDYAEIRRRNDEAAAEQRRAAAAAREFYAGCAALVGGHAYLTAHGLDMTGCRGLKVDRKGWLVVPMGAKRELMSVQRISPDGEKRFWAGAPTAGASYRVERPRATVTILCEGLATGLALFAAVPTARVVVAFNCRNFVPVAESLPKKGMVAVAADNDHETQARLGHNPGLDAAREAAALLGCEVAVPEGIRGTDFCDLRVERVAERVAKRMYGRRQEMESSVRRGVDAEIAHMILRAARYLPVSA